MGQEGKGLVIPGGHGPLVGALPQNAPPWPLCRHRQRIPYPSSMDRDKHVVQEGRLVTQH